MSVIGIDFGTTNTVLAVPEKGDAAIVPVRFDNAGHEAIRTALAFQRSKTAEPNCEAGPWAIDMFVDAPEDTRFLQSFKSFAGSRAFTDTAIFAKRFAFEDLLQRFIVRLTEHAGLSPLPRKLVIGRPVTFAGSNPDEALAHQRYGKAFAALGFEHVHFVLEPVAAAFFYAQRLTKASTILVGDFGGGTSDFSIMRFEPGGRAEALGHAGVGIAGDTFDFRIIDAVVAPKLGKYAVYKSWDKMLEIPKHYFASFSRWNELCLMNRPAVISALQQLADASPQRQELEAFIDLIEGGMSYGLYQAIARAKATLSKTDSVDFSFRVSKVEVDQRIARADFEHWIAPDLNRIAKCVDQVIDMSGLSVDGIDRVFLTGGSSFVPCVRQLFVQRFGADKIESGDQLVSIAKGLALIGAKDKPDAWSVQAAFTS